MSNPSTPNENTKPILGFLGLNERLKFNNPNAAEWDELKGMVLQRGGTLQRINGIRQLTTISGRQILNIVQTFDDRQNVIVQTDQGVYIFSEDELMGRTIPTTLTPVTLTEEEDMAQALLAHTEASGTAGGTYTTASTWQTAPLNQIIHQLNPDGSAASFVTALAGNQFTLATGVYRFRIKTIHSDATGGVRIRSRLFNVTTGLPAWDGLQNEEGTSQEVSAAKNEVMFVEGTLDLTAAPTTLALQHWASNAQVTNGFGNASTTGSPEVYRHVEITKTA